MMKTKSHNIRRFSFICTERTEKIPMGSIKNVISEPIEDHDEYHMMVSGKESDLTCVLLKPCSNGPNKIVDPTVLGENVSHGKGWCKV